MRSTIIVLIAVCAFLCYIIYNLSVDVKQNRKAVEYLASESYLRTQPTGFMPARTASSEHFMYDDVTSSIYQRYLRTDLANVGYVPEDIDVHLPVNLRVKSLTVDENATVLTWQYARALTSTEINALDADDDGAHFTISDGNSTVFVKYDHLNERFLKFDTIASGEPIDATNVNRVFARHDGQMKVLGFNAIAKD